MQPRVICVCVEIEIEAGLQLMNERSVLLQRDTVMSSLDPCVLQTGSRSRRCAARSVISAAHSDAMIFSNMAAK